MCDARNSIDSRQAARLSEVRELFAASFGEHAASEAGGSVGQVAPVGVWSAPGRINLIGEHTDYNKGLVLPCAIDRRTYVAASPRTDRTVRLVTAGGVDDAFVETTLDAEVPTGWAAYPLGVMWEMHVEHGFDMAVVSDVPLGAGLSSSAALEAAVALACEELGSDVPSDPSAPSDPEGASGSDVSTGSDEATGTERTQEERRPSDEVRLALAKAGQRAENLVVGAPTGIMDQCAVLLARAQSALLLDCRSLEHRAVPLPLNEAGLALLVVDTRVTHAHSTGGYAQRRADCEAAAQAMDVESLREVSAEELAGAERAMNERIFRRMRHVVTDNARVVEVVRALGTESIDWAKVGRLLTEAHASLRDDFEVSVPELDLAVEAANGAGALGARMTGGGFGGSAIALVEAGRGAEAERAVLESFAAAGYTTPEVFTIEPSEGARREV